MRSAVQAVLACPTCKQSLTWTDASCVCVGCDVAYSREGDIPRLLPPAAAKSLGQAVTSAENSRLRSRLERYPRLGRFIDAVRPPLPYDLFGRWEGQRRFEAAISRRPGQDVLVLDVGAGAGRDAHLAGLSAELRANLVRCDIYPGDRVDFVCDGHELPIANDTLDGVLLQGVVEHVARPWVIASEIVRALRPGGVVFCEAPFIQWYHEDPKDYYRFTEDGLKQLFCDCESIESGVAIGPVGGVVGVARELVPILFNSPYLYWPLKWAAAWLSYPFIIFDRLYRRRARGKTVALGVYLVARKPLGNAV